MVDRKSKALFQAIGKESRLLSVVDLNTKTKWTTTSNTELAQGGFARIYSVKKVEGANECECIMKVEPVTNGPLFAEINFFKRCALPSKLKDYMSKHKVKFLAVPPCLGSGQSEISGNKFRFLIIPKFDTSLFAHFVQQRHAVEPKSFERMVVNLLDGLKFLHANNFTQGDIKPENMMFRAGNLAESYFVDFGLSSQYCIEGMHQPKAFNKAQKNNGTMRYCSVDSHAGFKISRRGDLEMLIYSLLECIVHKLPWTDSTDYELVYLQKKKLLLEPESFCKEHFSSGQMMPLIRQFILPLIEELNGLEYESEPCYKVSMKPAKAEPARKPRQAKNATTAKSNKPRTKAPKTDENEDPAASNAIEQPYGLPKAYKAPLKPEPKSSAGKVTNKRVLSKNTRK